MQQQRFPSLRATLAAIALAACGAIAPLTSAQAAPPTDESIHTLLAVAQSDKMMDAMHDNMEHMIRQSMQQASAGRTLTPEQARVLELAPARLAGVMREEVSWAKLQPMMVQLYREHFDQAEVDGLIDFYRSPTGQAFVAKMPVVMQRSMEMTQAQMQAFMPRLQAAMAEVMREAKLAR